MGCIFTTYFAQHSTKLCQLFYVAAFFSMRNINRTIAYFYIIDSKFSAHVQEIIKLVANQEGLEKSTTKVYREIIGPVDFKLLFKVRCDEGSSKTQFHNIYMWM